MCCRNYWLGGGGCQMSREAVKLADRKRATRSSQAAVAPPVEMARVAPGGPHQPLPRVLEAQGLEGGSSAEQLGHGGFGLLSSLPPTALGNHIL